MNNRTDKTKGFFALLLTGLIFGVMAILVRILNTQLTPYQQIFFRNIVGFFLAVIIVFLIKARLSWNKTQGKYLFLFAIPYPLTMVFYTLSILHTKIAITVSSFYIGLIALTFFMGITIFKEKVTKVKLIGLFFALMGLIFFAIPFSFTNINLGLLYGLLAGIFGAIAHALRKHLGGSINRFFLVSIQMFGGIIIAGILLLFSHQTQFHTLSYINLSIVFLFGLLLMAISYFSIVGFQHIDLHVGAIIISSELIFAPLFAALIFKEYPTLPELIACLLIMLAVVIPNINARSLFSVVKRVAPILPRNP